MAVIRDVMPGSAVSAELHCGRQKLLDKHGRGRPGDGRGSTASMAQRSNQEPKALVDLSGIEGAQAGSTTRDGSKSVR